MTKKMNQWVLWSSTFLKVQEITCKIDSLYNFQIICIEFIPVGFSHRLLIWNPQTSAWANMGASAHDISYSFPVPCFQAAVGTPWQPGLTLNVYTKWKRIFFQYLRIRSREWWLIFVCWIHCYFPDCYLEIISYFFDPQVKRLYVKNNNISYLREWYGLIPSPGVYWVLISESILALSG